MALRLFPTLGYYELQRTCFHRLQTNCHDIPVLNFLSDLHVVFRSDCTKLHLHQ